jgi:hypothetical protein
VSLTDVPYKLCDYAWNDVPAARVPASRCWLLIRSPCERVDLQPSGIRLPGVPLRLDPLWSRFELPAGVGANIEQPDCQRLAARADGVSRSDIEVLRPIDVARVPEDLPEDPADLPQSVRDSIDAQTAIGQHIDLVNTACESPPADPLRRGHGGTSIPLPFDAFMDLWKRTMKGDDARFALIVRIATEVGDLIEGLCRRPRRVLRRERALERMERVSQVDAACLRWISRQPGRTVVEKAGPRQRLLSVVRVENADTPENRVLRDFAVRAIRAVDAYCVENRSFRTSARVQHVGRFGRMLRRLLRETEIGRVAPLSGMPEPNYVLMFDPRYKAIWYWYVKLRRLQQEQEDLWRWRHRMWSEVVMCSLMVALDDLSTQVLEGARLFRSHVFLRQEPHDGLASGRFIESRSPLPLFVFPGAPLRIVEISPADNPGLPRQNDERIKRLLSLSPDLVLRLTAVGETLADSQLIGVWTEFTPTANPGEIREAAGGLRDSIVALNLRKTSGILIQPAQREATGATAVQGIDYSSPDTCPSIGFRLAMNQAEGVDFLKQVLLSVLKNDT